MIGRLSKLAKAIAPDDFQDHPFYILDGRDIPTTLRPPVSVYGVTGPALDLSLQDHLEHSGQWVGRGPVMILNSESIDAEACSRAGDDGELKEMLIESWKIAVFLHELAHILSRPIDRSMLPAIVASDIKASAKEHLTKWAAGNADQDHQPPWAGHGVKFIRALCHVVHRAKAAGIPRLPDHFIFSWQTYHLSRLPHYQKAMLAEVIDFQAESFAVIRDQKPPQELIKLLRADLAQWARYTDYPDPAIAIAGELSRFVFQAGDNRLTF